MNINETTQALALAQAFDNRTVGEVNIRAWHSVLGDADAADVMTAIRDHYAETTEWIMPAHIRTAVRDMVSQREMAVRATGWAPGQHGVPKAQALPELDNGPVAEATRTAAREMLARWDVTLPEGSREALMPRREYWDREHRAFLRTRDAEPNPLYKPTSIEGDRFACPGVDEHEPVAMCGHLGHPVTSHVCASHGVPFSASYYDTQATAGTHDPKVDG